MSTGLSLLNALPDAQAQIRSLQQELSNRTRQLSEMETALRLERQKTAAMERGIQQLRAVLTPLFQGLQMVFGEIDAMGIDAADSQPQARKSSAAWESWKQRLGGQTAKAIDALLLHGSLTQTQLRIHIGCARGSVPGIVYQLNKAGLINKDGNQISLKDI